MRFFFFHNNFSHLQPIKDSNIDVHVIPASTNGSCSSEHVANFFGENDGGNRLETTLQDEVYVPDSSPREHALDTDSGDDTI
jgi:hypothetical protein